MPAIAVTSSTTTAASTTAPTAAASTPAVPTTAAPAAASRLSLAGFIHGEGSAVERFAIQLGNGALCILIVRELDEGEPARLTRHTVGDDADAHDFATAGGAGFAERSFVGVIRQIPYVDTSSHASAPGSMSVTDEEFSRDE
jgi:hypothetical protein